MRHLLLLLLCASLLGANVTPKAKGVRGTTTVGNLQAAAIRNDQCYIITDGASNTDCTTGAGTTHVLCCSNGTAWSSVGGGTGAGHTIQDEGSNLTARTGLNFVGGGVDCVDDSGNDQTDCTITGSAHGDGANCAAGNYPLGVDASAAVQSCTADDDQPDSDAEVPDAITVTGAVSPSTFTFPTSLEPADTVEGRCQFDTDEDTIRCGDAVGTVEFFNGAHTTNTNADTICAGTTTYLDGGGACDDISTVYENELDNSAGLLAALSDETGTGLAVFSADPIFTGILTIPVAAAPTTNADGEISVDQDVWAANRDAIEFYNGTESVYVIASADAPTAGEVPKFQADGTITWETDSTGGTPAFSDVTDATADVNITMGDMEEVTWTISTTQSEDMFLIDFNQVDDADATDTVTIFRIDAISESGDAGDILYGMRLNYENGTANTIMDAGIWIDNAETTAGTMPDAILITSTGVNGGITTALNVNASNITNAIDIGANSIITAAETILSTELDIVGDGLITLTTEVTGTLPVENGGTETTSLTDGGILLGSGTAAVTVLAQATNGQIPIGSTGADPVLATIAAQAGGEITVTNAAGTITLDVGANTLDHAELAATITFADADLVDFGSNVSSATEGLMLPAAATDCSSATAEGQVCWEEDATILHIGDGAALQNFLPASAFSGDATVGVTGVVTVADDSHSHIITDIDAFTTAQFATQVTGETGTGNVVFSADPTLTGILVIPFAAAPTTDADGELSIDQAAWNSLTDTIEFYDGTASVYVIATQASDVPTDNQIPKYDLATGEIRWEDDISGGSPAWETVSVPGGDQSLAMDTDETLFTWLLDADAALPAWTFAINMTDTSATNLQELVTIRRDDSGAADADIDALLVIENVDTDDAVDAGIEFIAAAGLITTAIEIGANVTNAFVTPNATLTMAELELLDAGDRDDGAICRYESTGLQLECNINTEAELETAIASIDFVTVTTDDITAANLRTLVNGVTGTGNAVFSADPVLTGVVTMPFAAAPTTDADGEIAIDQGAWGGFRDAIEVYDGTASTYVVAVLASDPPNNDEIPKYIAATGTIEWQPDGGGAADELDDILDPIGGVTWNFEVTENLDISMATTNTQDLFIIDIQKNDDADATDNHSVLKMEINTSSGDADVLYGFRMDFENGTGTEGLDAGIWINNAEATASSGIVAGILISSTGVDDGVATALDVSHSGITTAISIGANDIVTAGGTITQAEFDILQDGLIESSEIIDDTIVVGDLADTDFGDWACAADVCTLDANVVDAAEITADAVGSSELDLTATYTVTGTWDFSGATVNADFMVAFPAVQTMTAGQTVAADACGSVKLIQTTTGDITTDTTDTFTSPAAANSGCIMQVCNDGAADNITLDANANFQSFNDVDIALAPDECITVGSTGGSGVWYMLSTTTQFIPAGSVTRTEIDETLLSVQGHLTDCTLLTCDGTSATDFEICFEDDAGAFYVCDDGGSWINITAGAFDLTSDHSATGAWDWKLGTGAANEPVDFQNTTDNASVQVVEFHAGNVSSPADADEGYLSFFVDDSVGVQQEFARLSFIAVDDDSSSKDGGIDFDFMEADTLSTIGSVQIIPHAIRFRTSNGFTLMDEADSFGDSFIIDVDGDGDAAGFLSIVVGSDSQYVIGTAAQTVMRTSDTAIIAGDILWDQQYSGTDGGTFPNLVGARIIGRASNTWDGDDEDQAPTDLEFYTEDDTDTDNLATPRMTLDENGNLSIGGTTTVGLLNVLGTALGGDALLDIDHTASGTLTSDTTNQVTLDSSRTLTAGSTITDNYDVVSISRTSVANNASANYTMTGSVLRLENVATDTSSTAFADSVTLLELVQDADSTGEAIIITAPDPSIVLDTLNATDTDFWMGVVEDTDGVDDDLFQIGDGTTPGTNPFVTISTGGDVSIGTASVYDSARLTIDGGDGSSGLAISGANGSASTTTLIQDDSFGDGFNIDVDGDGDSQGFFVITAADDGIWQHATGAVTMRSGDTAIIATDILQAMNFDGTDGGTFPNLTGARIVAVAANTWDGDDADQAPTDLEFYTEDDTDTDNLASPRFTITSDGLIRYQTKATAPAACSIGDFYVDTSGAACACTATNTWSNMTATGTCA